MAKDPAFLFYPQDFIMGTISMTNEQIGIYIKLLCVQHQNKGVIDKEYFDTLAGEHKIVRSKFEETDLGFLNARLNQEMTRRVSYCESRRKNRLSGHMSGHTSGHMSGRMETETETVNEDVTVNKAITKKVKRKLSTITDIEFIDRLKSNPAYSHIDIDTELGKMDSWILAHPGRKKSRKFVVAWLNRVEKPMGINKKENKFDGYEQEV